MASLIITIPGQPKLETEITGPTVIGRSPEADLCLPHHDLSRKHCRIEPAEEFWRVIDLKSRMGTFVGEDRVTERFLKDHETIRLGEIEIEFRAPEEEEVFVPTAQDLRPIEPTPTPAEEPMPQRPAIATPKTTTSAAVLEWEKSKSGGSAEKNAAEHSPRRRQIQLAIAGVALLAGAWLIYTSVAEESAHPAPSVANASPSYVQPKGD